MMKFAAALAVMVQAGDVASVSLVQVHGALSAPAEEEPAYSQMLRSEAGRAWAKQRATRSSRHAHRPVTLLEVGGDDVHPGVAEMLSPETGDFDFQAVRTDTGALTNVILVRNALLSDTAKRLFAKYKDDVLFLGISSLEDYPLPPANPW